ncbi:hypothetical protein [Thioalkalivibrio sulfidiphilus]|uniref:hypothetical protein n=1 Tax=Thioalkalivibrio sulfidiphilus TaxID=1033854 RepID=UPI001FE1E3B5|nr:hypothetical protein [Thioalkalivibrio sulfidiphilus]
MNRILQMAGLQEVYTWPGDPVEGFQHAEKGLSPVKTTRYFQAVRARADRAMICDEWIRRVIDRPERESIQADGRIRRWARIAEYGGRYLRVVLLSDGVTVHNAFFDRGFRP